MPARGLDTVAYCNTLSPVTFRVGLGVGATRTAHSFNYDPAAPFALYSHELRDDTSIV